MNELTRAYYEIYQLDEQVGVPMKPGESEGEALERISGGKIKRKDVVPSKAGVQKAHYEPEGELVEEAYQFILEYLVSEEFASTIENAEKIVSVMSDDWINDILSEADWTAGVRLRPGQGAGVYGSYATQSKNGKTKFQADGEVGYGTRVKGRTAKSAISQGLSNTVSGTDTEFKGVPYRLPAQDDKPEVTRGLYGQGQASAQFTVGGNKKEQPKPQEEPEAEKKTDQPEKTDPKNPKVKDPRRDGGTPIVPTEKRPTERPTEPTQPTALDVALQRRRQMGAGTPTMPGGGAVPGGRR